MFATELNDELTDIIRFARKWDQAECRGSGDATTSLWFSEQIPDIVEAKAICGTCALIAPCLQGALDRREPWGVWGGELFANGKVLAQKRRRGRPPKDRALGADVALTA
jgi:WhiB family redox-sensing transcriptional regulator